MAFHFSRDTKVYMKFLVDANSSATDTLYEIPVLDGFSFSQATNTSEITLNEAADGSTLNSKRGRMMFNDSLAPVEWSFSTYMRPTTSAAANAWVSNGHAGSAKKFAVEGPLWAAMSGTTYSYASNPGATAGADVDSDGTYDTAADGNVTIYKVANCSVGSASVDFDIDGLAQVAWSGQGSVVEEHLKLVTGTGTGFAATKGLVNEGVSSTSNFVRQKLTSMTAVYSAANSTGTDMSAGDVTYNLTLTGGNITIENNLTYLTPETLGVVNQPLGHVVGTRSVSGNFTCYLNTVDNGSAELFENIIEGTGQITNAFNLNFAIGGSGQTPRVDVAIPRAHFEVPTHSIEDVISLDVAFHGLGADLSDATIQSGESEIKITYQS
jgi:hypothetical protein